MVMTSTFISLLSSGQAYPVVLCSSPLSHKHKQLSIPTWSHHSLSSSLLLLYSHISGNSTTIHLGAQMRNSGITSESSFFLTQHTIDHDWSSPPPVVGSHQCVSRPTGGFIALVTFSLPDFHRSFQTIPPATSLAPVFILHTSASEITLQQIHN